MQTVAKGLEENRPVVVWDALPGSYQKDITGLVHTFASKMDADVYKKSSVVAGKLVSVLRDKKEFILKHPLLAQAKVDPAEAKANWGGIVGMLDTVVNSDLADLDKLKSLDVRRFLEGPGASIMKQITAVSKLSENDPVNKDLLDKVKGLKVEVLSNDGKTAKLKVQVPGQEPKESEFLKVEGKWIPMKMAADWPEMMAEARKNLAAMTPEAMAQNKTAIMMVLGAVEPLLDELHKAKTAEQFNVALGKAMGALMGGMAGGAAAPPPPPQQ
jgi:hypothetical protein